LFGETQLAEQADEHGPASEGYGGLADEQQGGLDEEQRGEFAGGAAGETGLPCEVDQELRFEPVGEFGQSGAQGGQRGVFGSRSGVGMGANAFGAITIGSRVIPKIEDRNAYKAPAISLTIFHAVRQHYPDAYALGGVRREANTSLACAVTYYQATWDADILPSIHGLGLSLRTAEPLEKQQPGPMWHPLWINRYYDSTRDPEYVPFILKYARMTGMENCWTTALGALAHELSGDKSYLTAHLERAADFPKKFYRAPGDPYDWYGVGPGPIGDNWGVYMCWGNFPHALKKANITTLDPEKVTRFAYLVGGNPSLTVYALEKNDQPVTLTFKASSLGGDLYPCQVAFYSPAGKELTRFKVPPVGGPSSWTEKKEIPADGETGLYRFEMSTHEANVSAPVTDLPFEATVVPRDLPLETQ
jgi:hypothetical protein